jgi:pSer/pThr/pTyr-binding forkhead associated (FHA) protein
MERGEDGGFASEIVISQEDYLIGRGTDCDLRLRDEAISRHHCSIRNNANEPLLLDLGSSNGTYLNGKRIRSQASLHTGDEIKFGEHAYVVYFGEDEPEAPPIPRPDPAASTRLVPKRSKEE